MMKIKIGDIIEYQSCIVNDLDDSPYEEINQQLLVTNIVNFDDIKMCKKCSKELFFYRMSHKKGNIVQCVFLEDKTLLLYTSENNIKSKNERNYILGEAINSIDDNIIVDDRNLFTFCKHH